jgi:hypothetical protein
LKHLNQYYQTKYDTSFIKNLDYIKENGLAKFISRQQRKYGCKRCGGLICIHNKKCYNCDEIKSWKG